MAIESRTERLAVGKQSRRPSIFLSGFNGSSHSINGNELSSSQALSRRGSFASGISMPDLLRDLTREKTSSRLSTILARQMQAQLDISSTAVGPNTGKQSKLALYAARRKALLWIEDDHVVPRRRESVYSACRRKIHRWSGDVLGGFLLKFPERVLDSPSLQSSLDQSGYRSVTGSARPSVSVRKSIASSSRDETLSLDGQNNGTYTSQSGLLLPMLPGLDGNKGLAKSASQNLHPSLASRPKSSSPSSGSEIEWIVLPPRTPGERLRRDLDDMLHHAQSFADRNANLTASCIGITDSTQTVKWEKHRLRDLMEKERLIPRIFALQREINEISIEIKNKLAEKTEALAQLDVYKKHKEITDTILTEFFVMIKRFNDRKIEAERQAESRRESNATAGSHGLGSNMLLAPKHGKHHGGQRRGLGSHFMQSKHQLGLLPLDENRRSSLMLGKQTGQSNAAGGYVGPSPFGSSMGSTFMDSSMNINSNTTLSRRGSIKNTASGMSSKNQSLASIHSIRD